jgi:hypothetical protein
LGFEVLLACGWRKTYVGHFHGPLYQWSSGDYSKSYSEDRLPCPTGSIDAAMTLGEPGSEISISTLYGVAHVEYPLNFADCPPYGGQHVGGLIAPAICAAMLRAMAGKMWCDGRDTP